MFEHIILRRSIDGPALTAGEIAEALLFYQNVHIVLDYGSLNGLVQAIGMQSLLKVLSMHSVHATYIEEMTGTRTTQTASGPEYSLVSFRLAGHKGIGELKTRKKRLEHVLTSKGYKKSIAKSYADRFRRNVRYRHLSDNHYLPGGVLLAAQQDLQNQEYVHSAALIAAESLLGRQILPAKFKFEMRFNGDKFRILSNLDFNEVSQVQKLRDPNAGKITPAHITSTLLTASADTIFAGHYGGDYYTSSIVSKIIYLREKLLLQRVGKNLKDLETFKEVVLNGSPDIADVINSRKRSFDEFLELLKKADKFKRWLHKCSPEESVVTAYLEDITSLGWFSSIPGKLIRFISGVAIGALEPVSGIAVSAGDSFLLGKLARGWRPSHFISSYIKPFVGVDES